MIRNKIKTNGGAAMLIAVIFFLFATMTIILGVASPILKQAAVSKNIITSKGSYYLAESSVEDVLYRLKNGRQVASSESLSLNGGIANIGVTDITGGKQIISDGNISTLTRKVKTTVVLGTGIAFHYGVQVGRGGFILENSSSVTGNIYSSGSVTGSGNIVRGDVVSSGATGLISGIHATGTAYSHTISNSTIDKDAYYVTKTSTTVSGVSHPGSSDLPDIELPISDAQITDWEDIAVAGGTISCSGTYVISSNRTLGPTKIPCDLEISGSPTITLNGPVWVTGNITIKNSAIIRVASSLGSVSIPIIADKTTNRTTSSKIDLNNTSQFFGSGSVGSFVFLISQNNSSELGGAEEAISMDNSSSGAVVLYAAHGLISVNNSATLKEVTGYKIKAKNTATIIYDTGLPSNVFSEGPAGGYDVTDWREI